MMIRIILAALALGMLVSCSDDTTRPVDDSGLTDGPKTGDGPDPTKKLTWFTTNLDVNSAGKNARIASCGKKVGIAYFRTIAKASWPTVTCPATLGGPPVPRERPAQTIYFVEFDGTDWGKPNKVVQTIGPTFGLSMTYDKACKIHIGHLGGKAIPNLGKTECSSSNAMIASSTDGKAWTFKTVENTAPPGDTVGHWISVAVDNTGAAHVSHRDVQFGIYTQDGNAKATLMYDKTNVTSNDGSGVFSALRHNTNGEPVIAHFNGTKSGAAGGVRLEVRNGSKWETTQLVATGKLAEALDLNTDGKGLFGLVYRHSSKQAMMYMESSSKDLKSWKGAVQVDTDTTQNGEFSSLAFDKNGNPGVAYYRCGEYGSACDFAKDGAMFAYRLGGAWKTHDIDSGDANRCGEYTSLTFNSDNEPVVAYKCVIFNNLTNTYVDTLMVAIGVYK